jgi:hypothetical protein
LRAVTAEEAVHASCADTATFADLAASAKTSEHAVTAVHAVSATCADRAAEAARAEEADHAQTAGQAEKAEYAGKALCADTADKLNATGFFWINGSPNYSQIQPGKALVIQSLPVNVGDGESVFVRRIRCCLGFCAPDGRGLRLKIFASAVSDSVQLDGAVYSTDAIVDEVPKAQLIYTNTGPGQKLILLQIAEQNDTGFILHTDIPNSWWVLIEIKQCEDACLDI